MNIEEKYNIKYLRKLFTQLFKQFDDDYKLSDGDEDPGIVENISNALRVTYGYTDQDEIDFLYTAFIKNYHRTGGDFDTLGKSVKPFTPQLKRFDITENEWCNVRITNFYTIDTYSEALATSFLYAGVLEPDDYEQDILDCDDREHDIVEVKLKEKNIKSK